MRIQLMAVLAMLTPSFSFSSDMQQPGVGDGTSVTVSSLTITGLEAGSVLFSTTPTTGAIGEDNANFFWDDANNRLGVGTALPRTLLDVEGAAQFGSGTTKSTITAAGALNLATPLTVANGGTGGTGYASGAIIVSTRAGATDILDDDSSQLVWDFDANRLGVGTSNPGTKLHLSSGTLTIDGDTQLAINAGGTTRLWSRTKAQIDSLAAGAVGEYIHCSDCTLIGPCISTGTAASQWRKVESATLGCGTNN